MITNAPKIDVARPSKSKIKNIGIRMATRTVGSREEGIRDSVQMTQEMIISRQTVASTFLLNPLYNQLSSRSSSHLNM